MGREDVKLLERVFSYFAKKIKDEKAGWQTVEDALSTEFISANLQPMERCFPFQLLKHFS
jgi:hypothetical protein